MLRHLARHGPALARASFVTVETVPMGFRATVAFRPPTRFYAQTQGQQPSDDQKKQQQAQDPASGSSESTQPPHEKEQQQANEGNEQAQSQAEQAAPEEEVDEYVEAEPIHPFSIPSGNVIYEGPLSTGAKVLKRLSVTGATMTTALSPLIAIFGDPSIPVMARIVYSGIVFSFGLGTTAMAHAFVSPYVIRMKLFKDAEANLRVPPEPKVKPAEDGEAAKESAEGEEAAPEEEEESLVEELPDLSGFSVEYTTLNLFGAETSGVTSLDGLKLTSNAIGSANYVTKEGKPLYIHEDYFNSTGHDWFYRHVRRQRPVDPEILRQEAEERARQKKEDEDPLI